MKYCLKWMEKVVNDGIFRKIRSKKGRLIKKLKFKSTFRADTFLSILWFRNIT
ncbi:hypothetical protein ES705_21232 [subsurface metagenome]